MSSCVVVSQLTSPSSRDTPDEDDTDDNIDTYTLTQRRGRRSTQTQGRRRVFVFNVAYPCRRVCRNRSRLRSSSRRVSPSVI
jgi:hypothetical protein